MPRAGRPVSCRRDGRCTSDSWAAWYEALFDFTAIPDDERYGILPQGRLLRSACGTFLWQLVAPIPWQQSAHAIEGLKRVGLGVPDVAEAVGVLKSRGIEFVDSAELHPDDRGALTRNRLGRLAFELVHRDARG